MNPSELNRVDNVVLLQYLNECSVLHVLRERYGNNLFHTFAGPALLVINPMLAFNPVLYSAKVRRLSSLRVLYTVVLQLDD